MANIPKTAPLSGKYSKISVGAVFMLENIPGGIGILNRVVKGGNALIVE